MSGPPDDVDEKPARPYFGGGCGLCSIPVFASTEEAIAHGNSDDHKAKVAERTPRTERPADPDRSRSVPARRPRMQEGKPWEMFLPNSGILNLGSYAFGAVVGFVELAHDLLSERTLEQQQRSGDDPTFTMSEVEMVAEILLDCADQAQAGIRPDKRIDRMDVSHTRARGAIRTALRVYPLPDTLGAEQLAEWHDELIAHAGVLLRISFDLMKRHYGLEFP